jgi:hypothetical protein
MRVQQKPESQIFDLRQLAVRVLKLVLVSLTFPFGFRVNGWRESDDKTAWLGRHAACPIGCSARAADVTGHWRVTITTPDGSMTGVALFKQSGDAVTGWVGPSEDDPITITGVVKGNKLTCRSKVRSSSLSKVASSCSEPADWPDERTGDAGVEYERTGPVEGIA